MPGIFQGDIIIKAAIELGFEDMRKNPWLIDHMLEDLVLSPYLKDKYGQKQIDACKEWFANNQVDIYMRPRDDRDRLPCITIDVLPSSEKVDQKHLNDLSPSKKMLVPNKIGKPIPYVVKPFVPEGYDEVAGLVQTPGTVDLSTVSQGMVLVNPANGTGYTILGINPLGILIEPNQQVPASELGVVPQYQYYEARIKRTFFEESYVVSCHGHGDIQTVLWLWSIVKYSILRYRESLLEANGFAESYISSNAPDFNREWTTDGGEKAYTRSITLTGQVENTWIAAPHRVIETISLKERKKGGYTGGIKILSNSEAPDFIDKSQEIWYPIKDTSGDDEDSE